MADGHFWVAEELRMTLILEGSVSKPTQGDHKRFLARWVGLVAEWRGTDDVALRRREAPIEKAKIV